MVAVEGHGSAWEPDLLPDEAPLVARAVAKRRHEFAAGRAFARQALAELGRPDFPILTGAGREPLWPDGIVGSITHCDGYCAAAVARQSDLRSLGIDAERNVLLPPGVLRLTCTERERGQLPSLAGVSVPALIFSAKESVYKAWYPLARRWLDYLDAEVDVDVASGRFRARLLVEPPPACGLPGNVFEGRFAFTAEHVFTAVAVPSAATADSRSS